MRFTDSLSLRLSIFLCTLLWNIRLWAQDDDDDLLPIPSRGDKSSDAFDMDAMTDYYPISFSISDIVMVVLLLVACYVFGKIWKGCTYLLLAFAALMYYLLH